MNTYLWDVLDPNELSTMVDEGYVRVQTHPLYPYNIACYTKRAMFEREWNNTTTVCRGLIWRQATGKILARPFKKFFNYGEPGAAEFSSHDIVNAYDKVDGSLGIAYMTPDGPAIATKGSFTSDQALHATELLRTQYPAYEPEDWKTDLFEIIYPDNRIVVDYGDTDALVYLGSVDIEDGSDHDNSVAMGFYGFRRTPVIEGGYFADVVQRIIQNQRPNAEGVVIHREYTGDRIKLKQQDYIELHKVMTGLNERQVWEWFGTKDHLDVVLVDLPEELHEWVSNTWKSIGRKFDELALSVIEEFFNIRHLERKEFALSIKDKPAWMKGALFARYDNNIERAAEICWKAVRP